MGIVSAAGAAGQRRKRCGAAPMEPQRGSVAGCRCLRGRAWRARGAPARKQAQASWLPGENVNPLHHYTNARIIHSVKAVRFVETARKDLAAFPETARRRAGYELFMLQAGRMPADFKPMPSVGSGAYEIRVRDKAGAFRVIYLAKFEQAVYVLHAFQKKTRKTPQADIELAARRYKLIGGEQEP